MYIQPPTRENRENESFTLPRGYSGTAFRETRAAPEEPLPPPPMADAAQTAEAAEEAPHTAVLEPTAASDEDVQAAEKPDKEEGAPEAVAAFAGEQSKKTSLREGGLFSRIPFLSSLLPPSRGERSGKGDFSEWITLGLIAWLLLDSKEDDMLPFLVALLLWD